MSYIKEEDIIKDKINITEAPFSLNSYDMYYIHFLMKKGSQKTVRVFCEKGTFPKFSSPAFENLKKEFGPTLITDFFVKQLIGKQGLMHKDGRDDFIYLGRGTFDDINQFRDHLIISMFLDKNLDEIKYWYDRLFIRPNGKSALENFENNLFSLKLQVQAIENSPSITPNNQKGKTYVISDIHGMLGSYKEIMEKLSSRDHLIILGDVIDRGPGGIQIIQDIMKKMQDQQNNPEITFMIGNHEMLFIETVGIMIIRGLHKEDLKTIMARNSVKSSLERYSSHNDLESREKHRILQEKLKPYENKYQNLINEKGLTDYELGVIEIWLNYNGGDKTIFQYLLGNCVKTLEEQKAIYSFLLNSYIVLPKNINGKDYLFVHAMPPNDLQMIKQMKQSKKGYKYNELTGNQFLFMLQEREHSTYEQAKACGFTTICGHTPSYGQIIVDDDKGFVRIDAGCGHKQKTSKLALYCIDDGSVEFFDEKEFSQDQQAL